MLVTADHASHAAFAPEADARSWRDDAACRGMSPAESERIFFPEATGELRKTMYDEAHTYCERCPVVEECLSDAIEMNDRDGYRGGMPAAARVRMRSRIVRWGVCVECGIRFPKATQVSRFCSPAHMRRQRMRVLRASRSKEFL